MLGGFWAAGTAMAGYGLFVKKYNMVWTFGPYLGLWIALLYNWARQPQQDLENKYKYIVAKRAATCALEMNRVKF